MLNVLDGTKPLFNDKMSTQLSAALPPTVALRRWKLLFDTNFHGISLLSFYKQTEGAVPALLVIKDENDRVRLSCMLRPTIDIKCFGGYNPEGFAERRHFYGNGESFVFSFDLNLDLKVYYWSGLDNLFVYSDKARIMFGGGYDGQKSSKMLSFSVAHVLSHWTLIFCKARRVVVKRIRIHY